LLRDAFRADADRIVGDLKDRATGALAALATAAEVLHPGDTAETAIARGDKATRAWRTRTDLERHAADLETITDLAESMADRIGVTRPDQRRLRPPVLWWVDVRTSDQLTPATQLWDNHEGVDRWLALIHAGHTPTLATPAERDQRAQAIAHHDHRLAQQAEESRRAELVARNAAYTKAWQDAVSVQPSQALSR